MREIECMQWTCGAHLMHLLHCDACERLNYSCHQLWDCAVRSKNLVNDATVAMREPRRLKWPPRRPSKVCRAGSDVSEASHSFTSCN